MVVRYSIQWASKIQPLDWTQYLEVYHLACRAPGEARNSEVQQTRAGPLPNSRTWSPRWHGGASNRCVEPCSSEMQCLMPPLVSLLPHHEEPHGLDPT